MHLQKAVDGFDVFARSLSIGAETMVMNFDPDQPMHERYSVSHDFLDAGGRRRGGDDRSAGQRVLPLGVQLLRDAGQGRRGAPDRLRQRLPRRRADLAALLLPVGDEGAGEVVGVLHRDRPRARASTSTPAATSTSPTATTCPTPRSSPRTGASPTTTSRSSATRTSAPSRLAHLDDVVLEWVESPEFDDLLVDTVRATFPRARARPLRRALPRAARGLGARRTSPPGLNYWN